MKQLDKKLLFSKEAKSLLKISDCKLMHLRLEVKIRLKKGIMISFIPFFYKINRFFIKKNKTYTIN